MPRVLAGLSVLALLPAAGCGTEDAADDGPVPLPDATFQRVLGQGVDPGLVYAVELPGSSLAEQSAGVLGDADYGATYVPAQDDPTGQAHLRVSRGTYHTARCGRDPLPEGVVASCVPDATGWYRTGGGWQEYVVASDGHVLALSAPVGAVDRADLVAAALGARRQDGGDLTPATPSSPVSRGDLPTTGDGAPIDPYGTNPPGG
ncbi:hypothetical protein G5V59_23485 [Nocardioides sp. W3-2-3]|uniref:hypothetical protein n=1 Tax=Nocardioides convexus TaxID=2712224 RepID=UPI00241854C5|nr:hypothetical protein [Nocardioides convexus]NHA01696.1 hypothetical protein [Nocardioides convexus]